MENKERVLMPWEQLMEYKFFRFLYPRLLALIPAFIVGAWLDEYARRQSTSGITDCFCSSLKCIALRLLDNPQLVLSYPMDAFELFKQEPILLSGFLFLLFSFIFVSSAFIISFHPEIKSVFKTIRRHK